MDQLSVSREDLSTRYAEILFQNPLLKRVEVETRLIGWTDEEIRTFQLLLACASNASLKQRLGEVESRIAQIR
jgi:hypothetical protein